MRDLQLLLTGLLVLLVCLAFSVMFDRTEAVAVRGVMFMISQFALYLVVVVWSVGGWGQS